MIQNKTVSLLSKAVATAKTQKRTLASVSKPFSAPKASFRNQKQVFNTLQCNKNFSTQKNEIRRFYATLPQGISEVRMPALSPTMEQGNLVQWKVKVGDKVTAGDVLCSVETDKATLDFENQSDAYIAKIIVPEGTKEVKLGTVIALFASKPEFIKNADQYASSSAASTPTPKAEAPQAAPQQQSKPAATASALPAGATVLKMPALSPSPDMTEATLVEWKVKVGDKVVPGDVLGGVQTDKAVVDFENQAEGFVGKLLIQNGTRVPLGTPVAVLVKRKEDVEKVATYTGETAQEAPAPAQQQSAPQQTTTTSAPVQSTSSSAAQGGRVVASPLAKKIASEQNVNLSQISEGTGPNNRIIKQDVERFIAQRSAQPSVQQQAAVQQAPAAQTQQTAPSTPVAAAPAGADFVDIPVSNVRRVIANRLLESKRNIPHYYLTVECEVDALLKVRGQLNKLGESRGYKLSVNDFIVKAASLALKKVPEANSSWQGDYIRQYKSADISVAVQTDNGLITPIVFSADKKGVAEISDQVKSLAQKARQGKLQPQEFQGGSFTISNLGMFGISEFAAIINPPQACILAVGSADKKVVPNEGPDAKENPYKVVTVMKVTLSCDHRVVDGAVGAQWLQAFKEHIENPLMLML